MLLIPFEKLSIKTNSSRDEIVRKLSTSIEEEYKIKINDYEFKISKIVGRGITIIINGQIKDCCIDVVIRPSQPTTMVFIIFFIVSIFLIFAGKSKMSLLFPLVMVALYIYLVLMTGYLSKKFKTFLAALPFINS